MDRAEKKALEAYPKLFAGMLANDMCRKAFIKGFEQAEKNIHKIVEKYQKSSARCMQQSADANEQGEYTYWDGFNDCAVAILRELGE